MSTSPTVEQAIDLHLQGSSAKATRILSDLANAGNGHAAHELGVLLLAGGADFPADREAGVKWLEKSVELGFEETIATDPEWFRSAT